MEGVDYSYARPDLNCLYSHGKRFVVRYFATGEPGKELNLAEKKRILDARMKIAIVFQDGTSDLLQGHAEGVKDARHALADAGDIGMPNNRPIYFALDRDPEPLTGAQINAIEGYLDGAASVLGRNRVGLYAGYRGIEVFCPRTAPWGWQTYAWSRGRISGKAHLRQYRNGVSLCGGEVDLNESYKSDFGQWPLAVEEDEVDPKDWSDVGVERVRRIIGQEVGPIVIDNLARYVSKERMLQILDEAFTDDRGDMDVRSAMLYIAERADKGTILPVLDELKQMHTPA